MKTIDLTAGNEKKALILFSLPMIAGNMLQQLYNVVDTLIVGKTLGANALAAVGSSYALMVLLTSIILGLCMGSGTVFAQLFGAKKMTELKISIYNSFVFTAVFTLGINVVAVLCLKQWMVLLQIPQEVFPLMETYLHIIFMGIGFTFLYNFLASVLRSIGNTLVPLLFLGVAAGLNIVLDIVFIVPLQMGIAGAAIATIIAQGVSAVAMRIYCYGRVRDVFPQKQHRVFQKKLLGEVTTNSLLTSIQQSIMNFGILMIQGLVNGFGVATMAAFAAVVKIDAFAYMPVQDFGNAFSTFIAQNFGGGKRERMRKGWFSGVTISVGFCVFVSLLVCVFAKELMLFFVSAEETEIIAIGVQYLRIEGMCYVGIGILFLLYGFYRGLAKAGMSIVLTVISLGSRVVLAYTLAKIPSIGLVGIWWSIPIGWLLADVVGIGYMIGKRKLFFGQGKEK